MGKPTAKRRAPRAIAADVHPETAIVEMEHWILPKQFVEEFPNLASMGSIQWDLFNRRRNGIEAADAARKVGKHFLVHRIRYGKHRLGEK